MRPESVSPSSASANHFNNIFSNSFGSVLVVSLKSNVAENSAGTILRAKPPFSNLKAYFLVFYKKNALAIIFS